LGAAPVLPGALYFPGEALPEHRWHYRGICYLARRRRRVLAQIVRERDFDEDERDD
jgi:hypothetical protein